MFKNRKTIPFAFAIVSMLYIAYILALGDSRMLGDEIGGDPGGMIIPLLLGVFMLISSVYIFLTDKKNEKQEEMSPVERRLFWGVVIIAVLYVAMARMLGFVLSTSLAFYILVFLNYRQGFRKDELKSFSLGLIVSEASAIGVYTACRLVIRALAIAGRQKTLPPFITSSGMILVLASILAGILIAALALIIRRIKPKEKASELFNQIFMSGMIAVISTVSFYLIFKQLFLVNLVSGIIGW